MKHVLKLFMELVKIPSATGKEFMTVGYIQSFLSRLGFRTWQDSAGNTVGSNCGNLYAYLELDHRFETVVFSAHTDTVLPLGQTVKPVIKGAKISSDGTTILGADNRGGIAAILLMAQSIDISKMKSNLLLFFPIHEESGQMGSSFFSFNQKIKYIFNVDESSKPGNFVYASLSHLSFDIKVKGKSVHAAKSYTKGIHAIVAASKLIGRLKLGSDKKRGWTMNIGKIEGGGSTNVVPDAVMMRGEVRAFNQGTLNSKLAQIKKAMKYVEHSTGAVCELLVKQDDFVPPFDGIKDPVLTKICVHASKQLGLHPRFARSFSSSDANSFSSLGYKVISVARGGSKPHSKSEYIEVHDIEVTAHLLECLTYLC
jgi:tripeptide aminopeptidase